MNIIRNSILIGFTVLGMAAANAQDATPAPKQHDAHQRPTREQMQAKMADMYAKRQQRLHDLLKLTAQQESAWATYQAAIKPAAFDGPRPEHKPLNKLTAPERLTLALEMTKKHEAMLETRLQAVKTFYAQLNPAQQTLFDEHGLGGGHGGMMRAHWRHHGPRGGWGHGDGQHEGWGGPRGG